MTIELIDTHTHFDMSDYDMTRDMLTKRAYDVGVRHLLLIGLTAKNFERMLKVHKLVSNQQLVQAHLAFGLHPLYIFEHCDEDLSMLDAYLSAHQNIAISEIGLDTFDKSLAIPEIFAKQERFFIEQIKLAQSHDLPIILHIRKAHGRALQILKAQKYSAKALGGIAHSFSGGEQEALAFVKMGFKLGITGQITNPNAKKLRRVVMMLFRQFGTSPFVIETDCPDMMPVPCQHQGFLNEPANLTYVLDELAVLFKMDKEVLARQLWQNTNEALRQNWIYKS
ncbi:TatD family hydrolase [Moraxella haemolytica]|uniref:TatD family hydrolase n=1 Tax=Moraxella haemolytica TaxID=2904119 RepID=UPI00254356E8|nr:TatD family hydrolase [Moraxella sp. ZY171148]WII95647.1 TatD family hydrolase [Moraxella sp. ZY171148]